MIDGFGMFVLAVVGIAAAVVLSPFVAFCVQFLFGKNRNLK